MPTAMDKTAYNQYVSHMARKSFEKAVRAFCCALLAVALCSPCYCQPSPDSIVDVANCERITPNLWRGALPNEHGLEHLAKFGIKTIIDLRCYPDANEQSMAECFGLRYFHLPVSYLRPSRDKLHRILEVATDPAYQPVFLHCWKGSDRTGTVIGLYRVLVDGWTFDQAYSEMRRHRFKPFFSALKQTVRDGAEPPTTPVAADSAPPVKVDK